MATIETNPKVDGYLGRAKKFGPEMEKLREIVLSCGLVEEMKWGKPCYTLEGANVALIIGFKDYCSLLLPKGALLKDPKGILVQPTENTQAARQIRFTDVQYITKLATALKGYIKNAIEVEKAGMKVELKKPSEHAVPEEFQNKLDKTPALKKAFEALTPGRRRAYLMHFSSAKQSQTRVSRIEKCIPQILDGKGMDDDYRSMKK